MAGNWHKLGEQYGVRFDIHGQLEVFRGSVRVAALPATEVQALLAFLIEGSTPVDTQAARPSLIDLQQFLDTVQQNALPPTKYRSVNFKAISQLLPAAKQAYHTIVTLIEKD